MSHSQYPQSSRNACWRRLTLLLAVGALSLNLLGLVKGTLGHDRPAGIWAFICWLPPIFIPMVMLFARPIADRTLKDWSKNEAGIWWFGILCLVLIDQLIPKWPHLVQSVALTVIGLVGYVSLRLGWGVLGTAPLEHAKHSHLAAWLYVVFLLAVSGLITSVWLIPESSLLTLPSRRDYVMFRSISSAEIIAAAIVVSIATFTEVLIPIFRTSKMVMQTSEPKSLASKLTAADVFICHTSDDKGPFVRALAQGLRDAGLYVWFDEYTLKVGDSLRRSIDRGVASSRYGIVVLSPAFFEKHWTQYELDGLEQRECGGEKVILPIWHNISEEQVREFSPSLAGRFALRSTSPLQEIISRIRQVVLEVS